jgi:hypothetical protein
MLSLLLSFNQLSASVWDPKPCLLAADGGVHPLDDSVDGISSHHKGVMLQDAVDIEALYLKNIKHQHNLLIYKIYAGRTAI